MINNRATTAAAAIAAVRADSSIEGLIVDPKTVALVRAIKQGDAVNVLACIKTGVNVNAMVPEDVADNPGTVKFTTPLGLAVPQLNYKIVKILLENGADPNILSSDDQSLLERLMIGLATIDLDNALGKPTKRKLTLFGNSLPIEVDNSITSDVIGNAEKLLDRLLCYDLNPQIEWTSEFNKGNQHITETIQYSHQTQAIKYAPSEMLKIFGEATKKELNVKSKLSLGVMRGILWVKAHTGKKSSAYHLPDYIASVSEVRNKVIEAAAEIKKEKVNLSNSAIASALHGVSGWVNDVSNLVTQYNSNFSKEVAKKRFKEKKMLKFWKTVDQEKLIALETKKRAQTELYGTYTSNLKEIINKKDGKPHSLVMEYLVDPTIEIGKDQSETTVRNTTMVKP